MAYQSLNIIGSFNAGTTAVSRDAVADRTRADAYRAQLRRQVTLKQGTVESVSESETQDRIVIEDNAHEPRRNPYMYLRHKRQPVEETQEPPQPGAEPGGALDVVV